MLFQRKLKNDWVCKQIVFNQNIFLYLLIENLIFYSWLLEKLFENH